MCKRHIDIREVIAFHEWSKSINSMDFNDIIWEEDGLPIDIDVDIMRDFEFIGLNNLDFINMGFHKRKPSIYTKENEDGIV